MSASSSSTLPPPGGAGLPQGEDLVHSARLGRFTILQQLGVGGMGSVFAAYDPELDRKVALKVLHRQPGTNRRQRERTLREARALARVAHPHVVAVHEVGEASEQVYLAMEFVDGMTLRHWQSCEPRSWRDVLRMYLLAGEGLLAAHQAGVVHRDFKPDNVLVSKDGLPKVADFGIARLHLTSDSSPDGTKLLGDAERPAARLDSRVSGGHIDEGAGASTGLPTDGSQAAGTLGYMAPEQRGSGRPSAASDQWSFCAALHEALFGRLPEAMPAVADRALPQPPWAILSVESSAVKMGVPPGLQAILSRGLATEASLRFDDMRQLLAALRTEHDQSPGAARDARSAAAIALSIVAALMWVIVQYLASRQARIVEVGVGISLLMILTTLLVGYRYQFSLRINPFHRWVWTLMLSNFVQVLGVRLVCTFLIQVPFRAAHILEMAVWGGTLAILGTQLMRPLRWAVLIPIFSSTVCTLMESPPRRLLLLSYPIMCGLVLWVWRRTSHETGPSLAEAERPH